MEMPKFSDTTEQLSATIPWGRENAISRRALSQQLGMSDRMMRLAIEQARKEGLIILNEQTGKGYFQSADKDDMLRQYRQDTARAMAILSRRKPLRELLKEMGEEV